MSRGILISFEGGEGTGKSTQLERLGVRLAGAGREVVRCREPGGTPLAEAVRAVLLDPGFAPDGLTELLLLEACRRDLTRGVIQPALGRGAVVLCDRYADSSTVYQGLVRGLGPGTVGELNRLATGGLEPDLTVLLDLEPTVACARARRRNVVADRLDDEPDDFHQAVREGFLRLAADHPDRIRVVDASGAPEEVAERVAAVVAEVVS